MAPLDEVVDGKVEVVGPTFAEIPPQGHMDMGIVVKVAGRQMQQDFEPVLERQIHYFVNGASGIQHIGQRDIAWIRISNGAADKGFDLEHFGKILHARFKTDFGAIVDKVQVTIYTDPEKVAEWLGKAREAYDFRNKRLADLTDDKVEEFYSCTLCQSFAPNHVCVVSPERLGLCGAYNWLDCKASFNINPTGPNQPIKLGKMHRLQEGLLDRHQRLCQDRLARRGGGSLDVLDHGKPDDSLRLFRVHRDADPGSQRRDGGQPRRHQHDPGRDDLQHAGGHCRRRLADARA